MREIDRELWIHIAECLGIGKRKLTRMVLTFEINAITTIETTELIFGGTEKAPKSVTKQWELKEVEPITTS